MVLEIFKIVPRLRDRHIFIWQSENFEHFQYLKLETDLLENENLF